MKKTIFLILALALCMSLYACGGGDNGETTYTEGTENVTESRNEVTEETVPDELAEWMPYLCGEWQVLYRDDVDKMEPVILSADGTVRIGERSIEWEVETISESEVFLHFCDGQETVYEFYLTVLEDDDLTASVWPADGDPVTLFKPSHYEMIAITADNFDEYFELRCDMEERVNGFGEVETVKVFVRWALKDAYFARLSELLMDDAWDRNVIATGAIEYGLEMGALTADIAPEEKIFSVTEFVSRESKTNVGEPVFTDYYGFPLTTELVTADYLTAGAYENPNSRHGFELVRIELTLYLISE